MTQERVLTLEKFGVYELGFVRGSTFHWKYIGKASSQTLYKRLRCYHQPSRSDEIPPQLQNHIHLHRNLVWFHVFATNDPFQTEQQMLRRHGISSQSGDYEWNRKVG
jgi:hypothetical protein